MKIEGRLDPYFETGTEGVVWSLMDPRIPGYDGLFNLDDGDTLTVLRADKIVWQGVVDLEWERGYRPYPMNPSLGQQEIFGYWVHGFQRDLEPEVWAKFFFDNCRAIVEPTKAVPPHPFRASSSAELQAALQAMPDKTAASLMKDTIYGLINWFGRRVEGQTDEWEVTGVGGLGEQQGLSEAETLGLMGSPAEAVVAQWKVHQFHGVDRSILLSSAMLFGVLGGLGLRFETDAERAAWLRTPQEQPPYHGQTPLAVMQQGGAAVVRDDLMRQNRETLEAAK